ncbi:hypothetical protein [Phenylobacterium sp. NIBR 498073]|uniref:hypothetical protein n=1 Tax=Phenylobacterium sp. NIBR 498073 TaxID=3015177 RepID=UPI0022B4789A|nr:hypothetical protein [Phenylobacterium sp. NIBR 498073]WGU38535.1 hypothetical protein O4N75_12800 [Phenylobacterium sp. NIBR 498073]
MALTVIWASGLAERSGRLDADEGGALDVDDSAKGGGVRGVDRRLPLARLHDELARVAGGPAGRPGGQFTPGGRLGQPNPDAAHAVADELAVVADRPDRDRSRLGEGGTGEQGEGERCDGGSPGHDGSCRDTLEVVSHCG